MKLPKLQKWEPVLIHWNDATGGEAGWHKIRKDERNTTGCVTVGQVESQTRETITLVLSRDKVYKNVDGTITIPVGMITLFARLTNPHADS